MPVYKHTAPTKDGRIWRFQVSYKDADGKYRSYKSRLFATKKEAERMEAKWILEHKGSPGRLLTFNDIIPEYLAEKKATIKPQSYDREVVLCGHVSRFLGAVPVERLSAVQYEEFRSKVLAISSWSVTTKNKVNKEVKALLDYAARKYDIVNNVPKRYKSFSDSSPKKPMAILTLEEFDRFIAFAREPYYSYFTFLMFTGSRLNEANALTWADVDLVSGKAHICKTIVAKTRSKDGLFAVSSPKTPSSDRVIPIPKRALECLKTLHAEQMKDDQFSASWFCFGGPRPLPETSITKEKDRCLSEAGLHPIRVHDFRHSYVSMLVNNFGVDNILLISRLVGHGSVQETLKTYSHLWSNALDDLVSRLNEI